MGAIEEHKPAEKRRALGRGLDSLLPSGPRVVVAAAATSIAPSPAVMPPPIVIPTGAAAPSPSVVPDTSTPSGLASPVALPGEIAELHAGVDHRKSPPKDPSASLGISAAGSAPAERLNLNGAPA